MKLDDFLGCFFTEDEPIHLRGFSPKELVEKERVFTKETTRVVLRENKLLQTNLIEANKKQGLYFVVNSGGFEKSDITKLNAVFCEIDNLPIQEQHDLYDLGPLTPSLRLETKKSVHAYWLLSEPITLDQWSLVQNGLIRFFKSDAGLKNENRLMRLPYFNHVSWHGDFQFKKVTVHTFQPDYKYSFAELHAAFPYSAPKVERPKYEAGFNNETIEGIQQELRYRISQLDSYRIESDKIHASCQGVCHQGESKSALMVNLRTGEVFCHAGCNYWRIAETFGLYKPVKATAIQRIQRRPQTSKTGQYLENYVRGKYAV